VKNDPNKQEYPFLLAKALRRAAQNNRVVRSVLTHTHVLQIIDDHLLMAVDAGDDLALLCLIARRLRRELARACVNLAGVEIAVHGAVGLAADPSHGAMLLILGAIITYFSAGKG